MAEEERAPPVGTVDVPIEYKVEDIDVNWSSKELEDFLNTLGPNHWRLIHMIARANLATRHGIFSRELKSEELPPEAPPEEPPPE